MWLPISAASYTEVSVWLLRDPRICRFFFYEQARNRTSHCSYTKKVTEQCVLYCVEKHTNTVKCMFLYQNSMYQSLHYCIGHGLVHHYAFICHGTQRCHQQAEHWLWNRTYFQVLLAIHGYEIHFVDQTILLPYCCRHFVALEKLQSPVWLTLASLRQQ